MRTAFLLLVGGLALWPSGASAQDVPSDVRLHAFLAPEGRTLRLLVRVPMASMNSVEHVVTRVDLYEGDRRLGPPRVANVRVSLPSDTSFASYESALAHVTGPPLPAATDVVARQALLDALIEYRIESPDSPFSIEPRFDTRAARASTALTWRPARGGERTFEFHGDPGLVRLEPRRLQAADRLAVDGFAHTFSRIDSLLFLLCLAIPFRQVRQLAALVAAFAVAHAVVVIASVYGMAPDVSSFPPLVDALIAVSVVYVALENIVSPVPRRRGAVAFAFGLVHGFGSSFALRDSLQFAGGHLLTAALSFDMGIAIGQILMLIVALPACTVMFRHGVAARLGTIVLSALVTHTAWHWTLDRGALLLRYPLGLPVFDAALVAFALRWLTLAVALAAVAWLLQVIRAAYTGSDSLMVPRWRRT